MLPRLGALRGGREKKRLNLGLMSNVIFPGTSYTSLFLETPALFLAVKRDASCRFSDLNVPENHLGALLKLANTESAGLSISEVLHSKRIQGTPVLLAQGSLCEEQGPRFRELALTHLGSSTHLKDANRTSGF